MNAHVSGCSAGCSVAVSHAVASSSRARLAARLQRRAIRNIHAAKEGEHSEASKTETRRRRPKTSKSAIALERKGKCYGCGHPLQTDDAEAAGYVEEASFAKKQQHKQLDRVLCVRCHKLNNGSMIPAVEDVGLRDSSADPTQSKRLVTPDDLRMALSHVSAQRALVVLLVDLLDASATFLGKLRELVGRNPVFLVGTKADLLPRGTDSVDIEDWLLDMAAFKRLSVAGVHLVSARTGEGMEEALGAVLKERQGRDVYVLGAANVGKSAFVRASLRNMSSFSSVNFDAAAAGLGRYVPTESPMPGTTLGLIPLRAFDSGGVLFDTPGVHLHHRVQHALHPDAIRSLLPPRRLRPFVAPACRSVAPVSNAASYFWGAIARIDIGGAPDAVPVFYGAPDVRVEWEPTPDDKGQGAAVREGAFGSESVVKRGGMWLAREESIKTSIGGARHPALELSVSGLPGWVSVYVPGPPVDLRVRVWACRGVEVFFRPPIPVPSPLERAD